MDTVGGILKRLERLETIEHGGTWIAWTPTPTGWSGTPTLDCSYCAIGKIVFFKVYITGTSNATGASLTLPFTAAACSGWGGACNYATDNGSALSAPARWKIDWGESSITFYSTFGGGTWTNSGTKLILSEGFYQIP